MALLAAASLGLAACSSDDDGISEKDYPEQIVGQWEATKIYLADEDEWINYDDKNEDFDYAAYQFNANGTGTATEGTETFPLTYILSNSTLSISTMYYNERYKIDKLTTTELVLLYEYAYNGKHYTDREYYKRVK